MEGIYGILGKIASIFSSADFKPQRRYGFPNKVDYHPLYGQPEKIDRPGILLKTNFRSVPPGIEHLNGRLDSHFVSRPLYQEAWRLHKLKSDFNEPHRYLSPYFNRPIEHKQLTFINGSHVSSRDPYRKRRPQQVYDKLVRGTTTATLGNGRSRS